MGIFLALFIAACIVLAPPYAVARGKSPAATWNDKGIDLYAAGKYDAAIKAFDQAIKLNPRLVAAYCNRGAAYDGLNHPERAVVDYSTAIRLDPGMAQAYSNRAIALCDLGKFSESIKDWNLVVRRKPRDAFAYSKRGFCYQSLGNLQQALNDYDKAVSINKKLAAAVKGRELMRKALNVTASGTLIAENKPTDKGKPSGNANESGSKKTSVKDVKSEAKPTLAKLPEDIKQELMPPPVAKAQPAVKDSSKEPSKDTSKEPASVKASKEPASVKALPAKVSEEGKVSAGAKVLPGAKALAGAKVPASTADGKTTAPNQIDASKTAPAKNAASVSGGDSRAQDPDKTTLAPKVKMAASAEDEKTTTAAAKTGETKKAVTKASRSNEGDKLVATVPSAITKTPAVPENQKMPTAGNTDTAATGTTAEQGHQTSKLQNGNAGPLSVVSNIVHHIAGNMLFAIGQFEAAAGNYIEAANANPNDPFAYYRAGNALRAAGQLDKALADYNLALQLNPHFKQAISRRDALLKIVAQPGQQPLPTASPSATVPAGGTTQESSQ